MKKLTTIIFLLNSIFIFASDKNEEPDKGLYEGSESVHWINTAISLFVLAAIYFFASQRFFKKKN